MARICEEGEEAAPQLIKSGHNYWDCGKSKCKVAGTVARPLVVQGLGVSWEEQEGDECHHDINDDAATSEGSQEVKEKGTGPGGSPQQSSTPAERMQPLLRVQSFSSEEADLQEFGTEVQCLHNVQSFDSEGEGDVQ